MKTLLPCEMSPVSGGKINAGGWICAVGAGVAGGSWAALIGIASVGWGFALGLGWGLLQTWACDKVNDAYEMQEEAYVMDQSSCYIR